MSYTISIINFKIISVGQNPVVNKSEVFNKFLVTRQHESSQKKVQPVLVDIYLMNGCRVSVNCNSDQSTSLVLQVLIFEIIFFFFIIKVIINIKYALQFFFILDVITHNKSLVIRDIYLYENTHGKQTGQWHYFTISNWTDRSLECCCCEVRDRRECLLVSQQDFWI